jgi:hypothetical protein
MLHFKFTTAAATTTHYFVSRLWDGDIIFQALSMAYSCSVAISYFQIIVYVTFHR